jgi:hypothetical protein
VLHDDASLREMDFCCALMLGFVKAVISADGEADAGLSAAMGGMQHVLDAAVQSSDLGQDKRIANGPASLPKSLELSWTGSSLAVRHAKERVPDLHALIQSLRSVRACICGESDLRRIVLRVAAREGCGRPSHFERNALSYAGLTCVTLVAAQSVQAKSSALGGTGELEQFFVTAKSSVAAFFQQQLVEPVHGIYEQVFANTPSLEDVTPSNEESLRQSHESLRRVLEQFKADHPELSGTGMAPVLSAYEQQIREPIRNAVSGRLLETLLVFTAKLKSDVEEILVRTSKQMSAQRINLHILAAVPAVLGVAGLIYCLSAVVDRSRRRGVQLQSSAEDEVRYLIGDCRDGLFILKQDQAERRGSWRTQAELLGKLLGSLRQIELLIARRTISLGPEGISRLRRDLRRLECEPTTYETKAAITDRMLQVYSLHSKGHVAP